MANVVHPQLDFLHNPASHPSSRFGFGFALSGGPPFMNPGKQEPGHKQPVAFQQLTSHMNIPHQIQRVQKRRHEPDEEPDSFRQAGRDVTMDRSPTPERPRRAVPKRARVANPTDANGESNTKESKQRNEEEDVDVGILLASLPPQSLLPLLNAMLNAQPSLKSLILPLIPPPTLEITLQALDHSARKLRDAYPYSSTPTFTPVSTTPSLGFGFGFGSQKSNLNNVDHQSVTDGSQMRESYILSRLRPHINDFVSVCMSYVPYFSYVRAAEASANGSGSSSRSHSTTLQLQHKDKSHPSETFLFLSALTTHILSQPPLTQSSLVPLLMPRLSQEWMTWIDRIDEVVNSEGGMFGGETVRAWERTLDEFADARGPDGWSVMKDIRDRWVAKVGWLVGRSVQQAMDEL
ncbi:hypothetical protein F5J12DRAFT_741617 [Pisolithus orientalis]|uniref:uncharacterized protein n=1 Tax=Pisolithus orientalis TaxID=936130 RepID=UPI00222421CF|nr:uncharacterized protein F5J12DRAFT_741617 [Pisolithus orientalis]KAI6008254.1 hypothetical protein F5J12DRAFT_741617 [Pisolithus orientalis]